MRISFHPFSHHGVGRASLRFSGTGTGAAQALIAAQSGVRYRVLAFVVSLSASGNFDAFFGSSLDTNNCFLSATGTSGSITFDTWYPEGERNEALGFQAPNGTTYRGVVFYQEVKKD